MKLADYYSPTGRCLWKWDHYWPIYERHFAKFVGREVHILEIGVYEGGSLEMWGEYFGGRCHVYGLDIDPTCQRFANEYTQIFIGDQGDFRTINAICEQVPRLDVVVDDGSHSGPHQVLAMRILLPHLQPGGVYLCEDITQPDLLRAADDLAGELNAVDLIAGCTIRPNPVQRDIRGIYRYPSVVVIEKNEVPVTVLQARKRWEKGRVEA